MFSSADASYIFFIVVVFIMIFVGIYFPGIYNRSIKYISFLMMILKTNMGGTDIGKVTGNEELDKAIEAAGYSYDEKQDIFYSNMDAWQRNMGYCRLYDEAAAPLGMIIDCEPIYFEYDGKRWLIEFWKGQYDLTTGCEIGVYNTTEPDINIQGIFKGTFYNCASNADQLQMAFILKKNGKTIFTRMGKHWWLTGFKLGEFSEPSELTVDLIITLKDEIMLNAFLKGAEQAGYLKNEITTNGNTIGLKFNKPRSEQPSTRVPETDWLIQRKNKLMCDNFQEITKEYDNLPDKLEAVKQQSPDIYEKTINIGKPEYLFKIHEKIKKYLN